MRKVSLAELPPENAGSGIARKAERGERVEFVEYRYDGGSRFPVHAHASEQLTIVVQGSLTFTSPGGSELSVNPGELVLISANEPHGAIVPEGIEETVTYNVFSPVRSALPAG